MAPTRRQIRQLIREELSRTLREGRYDEPEEEGTGYEYLSEKPNTVLWVDGPVDEAWLNRHLNHYKKNFPPYMWSMLTRDFDRMLEGMPVDPDVVENYINADGTSRVSRQTVEALVAALSR